MRSSGDLFERYVSNKVHACTVPLLVSEKLLRERNMGQIDIGYIFRGKCYAAECKKGKSLLSSKQLSRLKRSQSFIGLLLQQRVDLIGIQQVAKLNDAEYPFRVCNIRELM
jgi:hypothetical protein